MYIGNSPRIIQTCCTSNAIKLNFELLFLNENIQFLYKLFVFFLISEMAGI